jgi:hypothetical protein
MIAFYTSIAQKEASSSLLARTESFTLVFQPEDDAKTIPSSQARRRTTQHQPTQQPVQFVRWFQTTSQVSDVELIALLS